MPADRSTILEALEELRDQLAAALEQDPPTAQKPFRRIVDGEPGAIEFPRPFLALRAVRAAPVTVSDDDKAMEVTVGLRILTDVTDASPLATLFSKAAAVDDFLDGLREDGLVEGVEGFDRQTWSFIYPKQTAAARIAQADGTLTFVVKVARDQNG